MNKIKKYTVLFFLLLLSNCAYEPILINKNYDFSIVVEKIDGDKKINSMIVNNFYNLKGKEKKYNLNLSSTKIKNVISKDSKGDPAIFELIINVNYSVKKNEETLGELFTFFMLETILLGKMLKINPYDQPSVELIKKETKKILI